MAGQQQLLPTTATYLGQHEHSTLLPIWKSSECFLSKEYISIHYSIFPVIIPLVVGGGKEHRKMN